MSVHNKQLHSFHYVTANSSGLKIAARIEFIYIYITPPRHILSTLNLINIHIVHIFL